MPIELWNKKSIKILIIKNLGVGFQSHTSPKHLMKMLHFHHDYSFYNQEVYFCSYSSHDNH